MGSSAEQETGRTRQRIIRPVTTSVASTCLLLVALSAHAFGQEVAVPDKPVPMTVTSYRVVGFSQETDPEWRFVITYKDSNGAVYTDAHHGKAVVLVPGGQPIANPEGADAFLKQLNTANFTTNSLTKRLLQHLVQHGKIPASTVTGTPESDK